MCPEIIEPTETAAPAAMPRAHRRGRPPGSRNKPKPIDRQPAIKPAAMRPEQAGAYIGVSVTTIRRLIAQGRLESRRIGSALVVLTRSLDAFLERGT